MNNYLKNILLSQLLAMCFLLSSPSSYSQRFPCDGRLIVGTNDGTRTTLSYPTAIPFSPPSFTIQARYNGAFDALGFNPADNYIYGVQEGTNAIVRLYSNNTYDTIGIFNEVNTFLSYGGDCSPNGIYMCYDQQLNEMLAFEVTDQFALIRRFPLYWDPLGANAGPFENTVFDFTFDPNEPTVAYTYQSIGSALIGPTSTAGHILRINLDLNSDDLGMVSSIRSIATNQLAHLGGILSDSESGLHGYGTFVQGFNPPQNMLFSINIGQGSAVPFVINRNAVSISDGCSCSSSFTFTKTVPGEGIFCSNDAKYFTLNITNNSFNTYDGITLVDTFPEGILIDAVTINNPDQSFTVNGLGSNILEVTNLTIPPKTSLEVRMWVKSIDAPVGPQLGQAFLYNLPQHFMQPFPSDNPPTTVAPDPSRYIIDAVSISDLTWTIKKASDCLLADDGQVLLSSDQFLPGATYQLRLQNKEDWEYRYDTLIASGDGKLLIDSLLPGQYQLQQITPSDSNCGFKLRDTTIILQAPNEQLSLQTSTNAPVCEGQELIINCEVSPAANLTWRGPDRFGSDQLNNTIDSATVEQSGDYRVRAVYGYCIQADTFTVEVRPLIQASILGDSIFCLRDRAILSPMGNGEYFTYRWIDPAGEISTDSSYQFDVTETTPEGIYQLIIDNGACTDSAQISLDILTTPSIQLPSDTLTDFCSELNLTPSYSGLESETYSWLPIDGLTCYECPSPQVLPIVQPTYEVIVTNENGCRDSAAINIELDLSQLVFMPDIVSFSNLQANRPLEIYPGCVVQRIKSCEIYDRWGNRQFQYSNGANNAPISWNGITSNGRLSSGVYVVKLDLELVNAKTITLIKDLTLVR